MTTPTHAKIHTKNQADFLDLCSKVAYAEMLKTVKDYIAGLENAIATGDMGVDPKQFLAVPQTPFSDPVNAMRYLNRSVRSAMERIAVRNEEFVRAQEA